MNMAGTDPSDAEHGRAQMVALLEWYAEMGVDEAIGETTLDRFALHAKPAPAAAPPALAAAAVPSPRAETGAAAGAAPEDIARDARAIAQACGTLEEVREALSAYQGCPLRRTAKNLVFADGDPQAGILFIGEGPGRDEDLQGLPFVGRSGQLLDRMMAAIGLDRTRAYICNVIFWRPPGNRNPTPAEMAACRPFSRRQIELARPDIIVALGAVPAAELIGGTEGILQLRGKWRQVEIAGRTVPVMPTLHPAYLLRQPAQKKLAWRDFLAIRKALDKGAPTQA
jgi:DNA polymerase